VIACAILVGELARADSAIRADAGLRTEYEVKAAYLFNFARFVKWPPAKPEERSFEICILGEDPFGATIEDTIGQKMLRDRPIEIVRLARVEEAEGCYVLFISSSENGRLGWILRTAKEMRVLTVAEMEGFAERGGMIRLWMDGKKARFDVNPAAVRKAGLEISAQLLKIARLVDTASAEK
jgi:hypothetical protein